MSPSTSSMPDFTGRLVNDGQYQLTKMLGSGAFGVVYQATQLATASSSSKSFKQFAIKVLKKASMSSRDALHVRREVTLHRIMSDHPNVVTMHHAFEDDDYVYVVLDYCRGGDLFGKICEEKVYFRNDELVKKVFLQILEAVHACHRKRIFHRDLKPENVLCNKDGSKIYLSDFGLSTNSQVSETFGCGSSFYMSPECIGKEAGFLAYSNRANDIWALGVILVNMISCRSPWAKALTSDDCFCDYLLNYDYLREMLPISEGANDLLRKIFAYEPMERITIPELRKAVIELDTFFMTDDEIAHGGEIVQMAASYCGLHIEPAESMVAAKADNQTTMGDIPRSPTSLFEDILASPLISATAFVIGSLSDDSCWTSESSSSGDDSAGPVTPSTHGQDPEVVIPELNIELGESGEAKPASLKRVVEKAPLRVVNVAVPDALVVEA
ncbi:hypothetical protein EW026_g5929 [Hermanssonia centrifuga]|uniref:Protein kinase domain-containing protein n=1 Tax=Hermanssonia centrifuga TaxID=98765 RepID=A0A4S4KCN6_9APHY|nr:hypothetical protein EW026_g5929 [Hermanssonia centrifuga]